MVAASPVSPRAAADDDGAVTGFDEDRLAFVVGAAEQRRDRDVEAGREPGQSGQAAGCLGILDLREHRLGDADFLCHVPYRRTGRASQRADLAGYRLFEIVAGGWFPEHFTLHGCGVAGVPDCLR